MLVTWEVWYAMHTKHQNHHCTCSLVEPNWKLLYQLLPCTNSIINPLLCEEVDIMGSSLLLFSVHCTCKKAVQLWREGPYFPDCTLTCSGKGPEKIFYNKKKGKKWKGERYRDQKEKKKKKNWERERERERERSLSYTSLRAHETELHLVCRLLLEKKNILIVQHTIVSSLHTIDLMNT